MYCVSQISLMKPSSVAGRELLDCQKMSKLWVSKVNAQNAATGVHDEQTLIPIFDISSIWKSDIKAVQDLRQISFMLTTNVL